MSHDKHTLEWNDDIPLNELRYITSRLVIISLFIVQEKIRSEAFSLIDDSIATNALIYVDYRYIVEESRRELYISNINTLLAFIEINKSMLIQSRSLRVKEAFSDLIKYIPNLSFFTEYIDSGDLELGFDNSREYSRVQERPEAISLLSIDCLQLRFTNYDECLGPVSLFGKGIIGFFALQEYSIELFNRLFNILPLVFNNLEEIKNLSKRYKSEKLNPNLERRYAFIAEFLFDIRWILESEHLSCLDSVSLLRLKDFVDKDIVLHDRQLNFIPALENFQEYLLAALDLSKEFDILKVSNPNPFDFNSRIKFKPVQGAVDYKCSNGLVIIDHLLGKGRLTSFESEKSSEIINSTQLSIRVYGDKILRLDIEAVELIDSQRPVSLLDNSKGGFLSMLTNDDKSFSKKTLKKKLDEGQFTALVYLIKKIKSDYGDEIFNFINTDTQFSPIKDIFSDFGFDKDYVSLVMGWLITLKSIRRYFNDSSEDVKRSIIDEINTRSNAVVNSENVQIELVELHEIIKLQRAQGKLIRRSV